MLPGHRHIVERSSHCVGHLLEQTDQGGETLDQSLIETGN
jgi:hypothetical protein